VSAPLIQIGAPADKETIKEARAAINDILTAAHVGEKVKVNALKALVSLSAAPKAAPAAISNCNLSSGLDADDLHKLGVRS
jgi:hypothetical protein